MARLVISLATRNRPDRLLEQVQKSVANWRSPTTQMYVQLDADDPSLDQINSRLLDLHCVQDGRVILNVQEREDTVAAKWNRILKVPADVYCYHADDDPYVTVGYDQKILEAADRFPDGIGAVFGHLANLSFSCTYAATKKYTEILGFLLPDYFPYWFCDHWTDDLARMIGRISFANITTDQSRPGLTQEMREPGWWATFYDAAYLFRRHQAEKVLYHDDFICPYWQLDLLKAQFPLIDVRSRMINQNVRVQSKQLEQMAGSLPMDDRYKRIKQRAIDMVPSLLTNYGMPEGEQAMFSKALGVVL